jgi:predicted aldo/keto reductase-like oxidoreductase
MQVLAAGALRPEEAFDYVCKQKKIESVLFGSSSSEHIKHSIEIIQQYS